MKDPLQQSKAAFWVNAAWAMALLCAVTFGSSQPAHAQNFTVLYSFPGYHGGQDPDTSLTIDARGNLYGAAGQFLVYRLSHQSSGWIVDPLHLFLGIPDGSFPSQPVFGPNGTLYGLTGGGGLGGCSDGGYIGCGTAYNMTPPPTVCKTTLCPWPETVLHSFQQGTDDGVIPQGPPVFDTAGNLYGTTYEGGTSNAGTLFELTPSHGGWSETILYNFTTTDPLSGVIMDAAGNLYGTAGGGAYGYGAVFRLTHSGQDWVETVLYSFQDANDGRTPYGGLVIDTAGNLYGTTTYGGANGGGTVFELTNSGGQWTYHLLYALSGTSMGPMGSLARDSSGHLYGLTFSDGAFGMGNLFKLTPSGGNWTYTDLHDFAGGANDGSYPVAGPALDANGNIFGAASSGGPANNYCGYGCGLVWEMTP